jgi:molybdenum cofactor cytidylyltransferase
VVGKGVSGSEYKVTAIVLAAGMSTRFPGDKLLYNLGGKPLIVWTVSKIIKAGISKIVVVLGHRAEDVFTTINNWVGEEDKGKIAYIYNPLYREGGMSSSIKTGLKLVCGDEHILIHPGDIPCLRTESITRVVESGIHSNSPITVAAYNGRNSHPIMFKPYLLKELYEIGEETRGLKGIVNKYREKMNVVETGDPGTLRDIDRPEDLSQCPIESLED